VTYLLELAQDNQEAYDIEAEITEASVRIAAAAVPEIAMHLKDDVEDARAAIEEQMEEDEFVADFMDQLRGTGPQPRKRRGAQPTVTRRKKKSGDEWKSGTMADLKKTLLESLANQKGADILSPSSTLHHKLSRAMLKQMLDWLGATPSGTRGTNEMWAFIKKVEELTGLTERHEDALCNWTANIELGVFSDFREKGDDPGDRFDGSYLKGVATPRTAELEEVALILDAAQGDRSKVKWVEVARHLNAAMTQHEQLVKAQHREPEDLTVPHLSMWAATEGGKYTRSKKKE
jgi:hypothetical protein